MALLLNRAVAPLVVLLPCLAGILINNIAMAQSPVKSQTGVSRIATQTRDPSPDQRDPLQLSLSAKSKASAVAAGASVGPSKPYNSTAVFIENLGQFDPKVRYQLKIGEQTAWLTTGGIVFDATRPNQSEKVAATPKHGTFADLLGPSSIPLDRAMPPSQTADRLVFTEDFVSASCCSKLEAKEQRPGAYNYFQSSDPANWRTNAHGYGEVVYHDVWPGIDLRIYGNGPDLEQEFVVQPGGDLSRVGISYRGIDRIDITQDGSLVVDTAFGKLRETKPRIYQEISGRQLAVDGNFKLTDERSYTFQIGAHASGYALVIDPTLLYSTFLGGSAGNSPTNGNAEVATGIAVDGSGNAYVAGYTYSADFPTTPGAFQSANTSGFYAGFITKLNATGSALVYSTYLSNYSPIISGIAVDSAGYAYVTGYTPATYYGRHFPTTPNAYWPTDSQHYCALEDFFLTALNSTGDQLVYSSCFNINGNAAYGAEYGYYPRAIAVDSQGRAFIAGGAWDGVPTTSNAYQPSFPGGASAYLAVFDTTASGPSSLVYATFLGPSNTGSAMANAIAVDSFGKAYITGSSTNGGFPITSGAFHLDPA